jgi:hypothetical protein
MVVRISQPLHLQSNKGHLAREYGLDHVIINKTLYLLVLFQLKQRHNLRQYLITSLTLKVLKHALSSIMLQNRLGLFMIRNQSIFKYILRKLNTIINIPDHHRIF